MILPLAAADEPPRIVAPGSSEVSLGRIVARVPTGTRKVILLVDGKRVRERRVRSQRVTFRYRLPRRDVVLRLVAVDGRGASTRSRAVGPVLGLPPSGAPRPAGSRELMSLKLALRRQASSFGGVSAIYVRDLVTGAGASWNAAAAFPAGSTLKVALALEALRVRERLAAGIRARVAAREHDRQLEQSRRQQACHRDRRLHELRVRSRQCTDE